LIDTCTFSRISCCWAVFQSSKVLGFHDTSEIVEREEKKNQFPVKSSVCTFQVSWWVYGFTECLKAWEECKGKASRVCDGCMEVLAVCISTLWALQERRYAVVYFTVRRFMRTMLRLLLRATARYSIWRPEGIVGFADFSSSFFGNYFQPLNSFLCSGSHFFGNFVPNFPPFLLVKSSSHGCEDGFSSKSSSFVKLRQIVHHTSKPNKLPSCLSLWCLLHRRSQC
jgi:hypothetical protein